MTVLVAPLDWGLGHASRCIPVIQVLLEKGCRVIIAANGPQEKLLHEEFPSLQFLKLPGYAVIYSRKWLMWNLGLQLFKIKDAIEKEHKWLDETITTYGINWVIADNRYGLWSNRVPCTFITHQLQVPVPFFKNWFEPIIQIVLYGYINRFTECWVPDLPDTNAGLSGGLGHPAKKPAIKTLYIGLLSRFSSTSQTNSFTNKCLVLLSGPEPQRTMLEEIVLAQIAGMTEHFVLVRGLPGEATVPSLQKNVTVYNHLPTSDMQKTFLESEFIISRTGYSTLMDAFTLNKKCILIPTPGQSEQEYLGEQLEEKKMALVYKQENFNLNLALKAAATFGFRLPVMNGEDRLKTAIEAFIARHL